ncbi:MAG: hypothetical protein HC821_03120 [Lewinella sp.]|nr:hypothetical protein [Lewinella sp.]
MAQFEEITAALQAAHWPPFLRHALNTNGMSRFPAAQYEMVRLGIGLYGLGDETMAPYLLPALRLKAKLTAVRELPPASSVGYGRRGRLPNGGRIGVLSIGYADGLPRKAGEGRFNVRLGRSEAPILGAVCMDMCMVDLSHLPSAQVGDEVLIFGPEHPIALLAKAAETIPYEILTGIGERVHRVYISE